MVTLAETGKAPVFEVNNPVRGKQKRTLLSLIIKYNALVILALLIVVASAISPIFHSGGNIYNLFRQQSTYMLISLGMLMVILTGEIDLSVSSMAAMGSIMTAVALSVWGFENSAWGMVGAIAIGIATCTIIGALNGFLVAQLKMPSFIVTLATMIGFQGVAYMITKGSTMMLGFSAPGTSMLMSFATGTDPWLGVPYPVYLVAVVVVLFYFIMSYTAFGRLVIATGSNETAVRLAGINTKKYKFLVFALTGLLTGVAGVIITGRTGTATALTASVDYNMSAIAGVVIGGCSLLGGEGSVGFTVIGVFIIAIIGNIMNLVNLPVYTQMVVKAAIIILAVLLKSVSSKKRV
jgi:ribose transport system permease protein